MPTRQEMWDRLDRQCDLLVVGGGITGAGIARDAACRGLSVVLVEMRDLAFGTSSRSSKLVHGGLRYLEHYEFSLVFEAVSERRILLDIAPHLVNPMPFIFPVYRGSPRNLWFINAGMWIYEGLSLFRSPRRHRRLTPEELAEEEPALQQEGLTGAPLYYDCATDDARLTLENALDAANSGAVIATWARVRSFTKDPSGRVSGAVVEDALTGALREVRAHAVVNATGPWTDEVAALSHPPGGGSLLRPTKGVHVVVEREKLPLRHAVVCFHPDDDRALFGIPWGERTYVGTTDTDSDEDPAELAATAEDIDYLLAATAAYFPDHPLDRDDILATWAGLRPLIAPAGDRDDLDESAVSREHQIVVGPDGLLTIAGGKLTTYRRMAAEVVDMATKLLRLSDRLPDELAEAHTDREPLPGATGWPADDNHARVAEQIREIGGPALAAGTSVLLADTYGMRGADVARLVRRDPALAEPLVPGRPEILAQVDWGVNRELACRIADILIRRTQLFFRDADQGLGAAPRVAERMAALLGWDRERINEELAHYRREVELSRRWRDPPLDPEDGE